MDEAESAAMSINQLEMFGRTLRASIAKDNGRGINYDRKLQDKKIVDTIRCFECGDVGHLSYQCPVNVLGERIPTIPKKSAKSKRQYNRSNSTDGKDADLVKDDYHNDCDDDSWDVTDNDNSSPLDQSQFTSKKKRFKKSEYFSDEEELSD